MRRDLLFRKLCNRVTEQLLFFAQNRKGKGHTAFIVALPNGLLSCFRLVSAPSTSRAARVPYITAGLVSIAIVAYAVTLSFVWDEGFHLIAAQMIQLGKRPYIDFCFPQTPLNAYWNAAWMSLFGDNWRVTHVAASLLMSGCLFLIARWSLRHFENSRWRVSAATVSVLLLGTNTTVFQFGPIAQAYAICMFSAFAALLLIEHPTAWRALAAGILTGVGAGSSLLIAPVAPVFFGSLLHRKRNAALFLSGCAIPFTPVIWLFVQDPYVTFFNVLRYQALFRRVNWGDATSHDANVLTSWIDNGASLLLALFFLAGAVVAWRQRRTHTVAFISLIASVLLMCYISTAHPTFSRYYIVGAPLFTVVATIGFVWFAERLFPTVRPALPSAVLAIILITSTIRFVCLDRDSTNWQQYERIAAKVAKVALPGRPVFADEQVYFLLHWTPPSGMEFSYAHKLQLLPEEETRLHIISEQELQKQTEQHRFAVFETCDDDRVDQWRLDKLYPNRQDFDDCAVFW